MKLQEIIYDSLNLRKIMILTHKSENAGTLGFWSKAVLLN